MRFVKGILLWFFIVQSGCDSEDYNMPPPSVCEPMFECVGPACVEILGEPTNFADEGTLVVVSDEEVLWGLGSIYRWTPVNGVETWVDWSVAAALPLTNLIRVGNIYYRGEMPDLLVSYDTSGLRRVVMGGIARDDHLFAAGSRLLRWGVDQSLSVLDLDEAGWALLAPAGSVPTHDRRMDITDEGVVIADKDYALRQISLDGVSTTLIADLRSVGGAVVPDPRVGLVATRDDLRFTVDSKSFVSARDGSEVEMLDPSWNPGLMTRRHDDLVVGQLGQSLATWSELGVPPEVFLAGPDIGDGELSTAIHHVSVGERFVFFVAANCALGRYPLPAQYQR